jgi:hypothetical protein
VTVWLLLLMALLALLLLLLNLFFFMVEAAAAGVVVPAKDPAEPLDSLLAVVGDANEENNLWLLLLFPRDGVWGTFSSSRSREDFLPDEVDDDECLEVDVRLDRRCELLLLLSFFLSDDDEDAGLDLLLLLLVAPVLVLLGRLPFLVVVFVFVLFDDERDARPLVEDVVGDRDWLRLRWRRLLVLRREGDVDALRLWWMLLLLFLRLRLRLLGDRSCSSL